MKTFTPRHLNLCKTLLCALLCLALTFSITSCGNLNSPKMPTQTGNFTFKISDEVIARIKNAVGHSRAADASRSAAAPDIDIEIHLDKTSGGQIVDPVTVSGSLEELNGRVIKIRSVPLNTPFIVSMVIKVDNKETLTGTSDTITLTSTDPTAVTISLKLSDSLSSSEKDEAALWGTWFFDYGYNQENAGIEEVTFNIDGTFLVRHAGGGYITYEKGTYTVQDGSTKVLLLHLTDAKNGSDGVWESIDVTNYYNIDDLTADELIMGRTKRDRSAMPDNNQIEYFDPPIYNHYYRMNSVTEDQLNGKWLSAGTGNQSFNSFSDDGVYMTTSATGKYLKATYSLVQKETGTELHTIINQFSDTINGPWNDIPSSREYIYNIWLAGEERFILMQPTGSIIDGLTSVNDTEWYSSINYYDTELVTYTYHMNIMGNDVTFTDRCPKGQAYTLPDAGKALYLAGVSESILNNIDILGYYTNQELSGSRVTSINATGNTSNRDFYVKFGLKCKKNAWYNDEENREDWNYETLLPANAVVQDLNRPATTGTQYILVAATLSDDIDEWGSIGFYANAENYWHDFSGDWTYLKSCNKRLYKVFEIPMDELYPEDANLEFRFTYSSEVGKVITLTDYDIIWLNDENSYTINYHVGDLAFTTRALTEEDFELPTKDGLWDVFYPYYSDYEYYATNYIDFEGWADDTGTPVTTVTGNVGETKDVYMNFTPSFGMWGERNTNDYGFDFCLPVRTLISDDDELETLEAISSSNPITIQMNATIPEGTTISNVNDHWHAFIIDTSEGSDWGDIGEEYSCVVQDGNNLTAVFTLQPDQGRHIPTLDDMEFHIDYHHEFFDEPLEFSNFEIHVLGAGDNWYNLVYHFGNMTYTEKAYRLADRALPTDMQYFSEFEDFDAEIANNLNLDKWYDQANNTGEDHKITAITHESVEPGMESHVYMNITPKMSQGEPDEHDDYAWFTYLPAQVFFTNNNLSDLSGMTEENAVTVKMKSEIQESIHQDEYCGLYLVDRSQDNWERVAFGSLSNITLEYGLWEGSFALKLMEGKSLPENIEDMLICFEYNKLLYDGDLGFTDFSLWIEH